MSNFKQAYTSVNSSKGVAGLIIVAVLSVVFLTISIAITQTNLVSFKSFNPLTEEKYVPIGVTSPAGFPE